MEIIVGLTEINESCDKFNAETQQYAFLFLAVLCSSNFLFKLACGKKGMSLTV